MNLDEQLAKLKHLRALASSLSESSVQARRAERLDIERSIDRLSKRVVAAIGRKNRRIGRARFAEEAQKVLVSDEPHNPIGYKMAQQMSDGTAWRWVDEIGRPMSEWTTAPLPPPGLRTISDERGKIRVETA